MKTNIPIQEITLEAGAAVTKFRMIGANGQHCGAGAKAVGITQIDADSGDQFPVMTYGIAIVEAGGAVTAGAEIESDANGKVVTLSAGKANGQALDSASTDGDLIRVKVQ